MDRLAALADIIPPQPPAPLPPLPWWQMPEAWWGLAALLLLLAWGALGWRRRRVWTQLQCQARAAQAADAAAAAAAAAAVAPGVMQPSTTQQFGTQQSATQHTATQQTATQLAATLRPLWPEADWPPSLRQRIDALRFAPQADAASLRQLALAVEAAGARAGRAAWWSHASAQRRFVQTLQAATQEAR